MSPPRIAVLGIQHYHANFWTRAILQSDRARHAGIWERDAALAAPFAAEHGVPVHASLEAALAACDAAAICSATADHRPLIEAAARAGKPILCEKPLGLDRDDGRAIHRTLKASGVPFMQSFPKRFDPASQAVRDVVRAGDLGRITQVRVRHGHSHGLSPDFGAAWFVDPALSGGGTLLDEGVHAADFLRHVFGEPDSVQARISSAALGLAVEDTAMAIFGWQDGLLAEVASSWSYVAADASIEVYGTAGTLLLGGVDIASRPAREEGFLRLFRRRPDGSGAWSDLGVTPHFKTGVFHEHVAWAFIDALARGAPMPVTAEDALRAFAMIDAAYDAARSGRLTPIAYDDYL
jgi:predicted dehydrogenase